MLPIHVNKVGIVAQTLKKHSLGRPKGSHTNVEMSANESPVLLESIYVMHSRLGKTALTTWTLGVSAMGEQGRRGWRGVF